MARASDPPDPTARPRIWRTAAVACAGLSVGLLPACTGGGTAGTTPQSQEVTATAEPTPSAVETPALSPAGGPYQVGDCWQEDDYVTASDWTSWEGAPAVDCSEPHNTITYAVAELAEDFPYPQDAEGQPAELSPEGVTVALAACGDAEAALGVTSPLPHLNRLHMFWYLPTPEQWAQDERFVRCDVGLREYDTTYADQALATMDGGLEAITVLTSVGPNALEMCLLHMEGTDSRLVSCSGDYTWRWVEDYEPQAYVDGAYPGEALLEATVTERCDMQVLGSGPEYSCWGELPSEEDWAAGNMTISLWSSKIG